MTREEFARQMRASMPPAEKLADMEIAELRRQHDEDPEQDYADLLEDRLAHVYRELYEVQGS